MQIRMVRALWFGFVMLLISSASYGQLRISVGFGPPALPVYEQPLCPGDGYIWVPGYWAWGDDMDDYYWVPGTWVLPPEAEVLWTPPYWAWTDGAFVFYDGYWGPQVGFYGGINYGFGYFGHGFVGGRWDGGHFFYNRSITNVNVTIIHNVYNEDVNRGGGSRYSFNGPNGVNERPTAQEEAFSHERHTPPVAAQTQHFQEARNNPQLRVSANHGNPPIAATPKPGAFSDRGVVTARGGENVASRGETPANNAANRPVHVKDLPAYERPAAPNTGNPKLDQKYQQQQQKLYDKQNNERQKLQQQQEREHQQA